MFNSIFVWFLTSSEPVGFVLLASYAAPVFGISTALNLANTCNSKRVRAIRFLLDHSVYYLWVNNVQAPGKLISRLSLFRSSLSRLLSTAPHNSIRSMDIFLTGAGRSLEMTYLLSSPPPISAHRTYTRTQCYWRSQALGRQLDVVHAK